MEDIKNKPKLYTFWELDDDTVLGTIEKRKKDPEIINKVREMFAAKQILRITEEENALLDMGITYKEKDNNYMTISFDELVSSKLVKVYAIGGNHPHITLFKYQAHFQNLIDNVLSMYKELANGEVTDYMVYRDIHHDDTILPTKRFLVTGEEYKPNKKTK